MSLEKQWQDLIKDTIGVGKDFLKLESDFKTGVVHFPDRNERPVVLPKNRVHDSWNVLEFSPEVFSGKFNQEVSAAVLLRDGNFEDIPDSCKKIYFAPSVNLSEKKKNILKKKSGVQVNFGIDPYSLGLWQSRIFKSSVDLDFLFSVSGDKGLKAAKDSPPGAAPKTGDFGFVEFPFRVFRLSSLAFDLAGASSIQQLATLLAAFVQLVEDYKDRWTVKDLFETLSFEVSLNPHFFLSVAKMGALRLLIEKITSIYGLRESFVPLFAVPSPRYLSTREPHNNLLRLTSMNMAAVQGGASGFVNLNHDLYSRNKGGVLSRNRDLLLKKESLLVPLCARLPALGSYSQWTV